MSASPSRGDEKLAPGEDLAEDDVGMRFTASDDLGGAGI